MTAKLKAKNTTMQDDSILLYAEMSSAQTRAVQRKLKAGELASWRAGVDG